jgi:hypothetical protein
VIDFPKLIGALIIGWIVWGGLCIMFGDVQVFIDWKHQAPRWWEKVLMAAALMLIVPYVVILTIIKGRGGDDV